MAAGLLVLFTGWNWTSSGDTCILISLSSECSVRLLSKIAAPLAAADAEADLHCAASAWRLVSLLPWAELRMLGALLFV